MMASALKKVEAAEIAIASPASDAAAIMAMIQRISTDPSVSIERIEQAFAFYEKVQASQSRKAFDAAMAAAKSAIPVIKKNRTVAFGDTKYDHEDFAQIARTVDPILALNGLSYRFRVTSKLNEPVTVTCVISHVDGHFEETTLSAGRDDSGKKNAIQSIGSALTYLQRYTLKAALGLAAAKDDDGAASDKTADELATLPADKIAVLESLLTDTCANRAAFLKMANAESLGDILAKDFEGLKTILNAKKRNGAAQ